MVCLEPTGHLTRSNVCRKFKILRSYDLLLKGNEILIMG